MAAVDLEARSEEVLVLPHLQVEVVAEGGEVDVEGRRGCEAALAAPRRVQVLQWNVFILIPVPRHRVGDLEFCKTCQQQKGEAKVRCVPTFQGASVEGIITPKAACSKLSERSGVSSVSTRTT